MKYHRWQERQAKMLGYLLLKEGLRDCGYALKSDVFIDHCGRPYVNHDVDFNISHTDGCVVCAVTSQGRLGIDIEKIKPIDFTDFKDCMSSVQWEKIQESNNIYASFFDSWTIKESTLKADGRGLSFPLENVETHGNQAMLDGRSWYITKLDISPGTSCHLACDLQDIQLEINEIHFKD
jgi:4'-phosphopantetheinyl transferase